LGREKESLKTEQYIFEYLHSQAYLEGTRYYPSPDIFLYFLARLVNTFPYFRKRYAPQLKEALQTRIGTSKSPLDLAARVITAKVLGISNGFEEHKLVLLQKNSQEWPADAFFKFGTRYGFFGCNALTTAFATRALETRPLYERFLSRYDYVSNVQPYYDETLIGETINVRVKNNGTTIERVPAVF